jgi:hypothetical protein
LAWILFLLLKQLLRYAASTALASWHGIAPHGLSIQSSRKLSQTFEYEAYKWAVVDQVTHPHLQLHLVVEEETLQQRLQLLMQMEK